MNVMNGNKGGSVSLIVQIPAIAMLLLPLQSFGGNLPMVEKRVEELGTLNNEAVKQIPGIPRDGTIDLKAYVTVEGETQNIRIEERKIQIKGSGSQKTPVVQGVEVSAPVVDSAINFSEGNRLGGDNDQQKDR